jgi:hypothetical protein
MEGCALAEEVHVFRVDLLAGEEDPVAGFVVGRGGGCGGPAGREHPVYCGGVFWAFRRNWVGWVLDEILVYHIPQLLW